MSAYTISCISPTDEGPGTTVGATAYTITDYSSPEPFYVDYYAGLVYKDEGEPVRYSVRTEENGQAEIKIWTAEPDKIIEHALHEPEPVYHPTTGYLLVIIAVLVTALVSLGRGPRKRSRK